MSGRGKSHNSVNFHRPHPRQLLSSFSLNSPLEKKILKNKYYLFFTKIYIYMAIINKAIETDWNKKHL